LRALPQAAWLTNFSIIKAGFDKDFAFFIVKVNMGEARAKMLVFHFRSAFDLSARKNKKTTLIV
jgi:hypothetical protein